MGQLAATAGGAPRACAAGVGFGRHDDPDALPWSSRIILGCQSLDAVTSKSNARRSVRDQDCDNDEGLQFTHSTGYALIDATLELPVCVTCEPPVERHHPVVLVRSFMNECRRALQKRHDQCG